MKKFLSIFLAVLMCVVPFVTTAIPAVATTPVATLVLGDKTAAPGDTIEVPISLTATEAVKLIAFGTFTYNTEVLEFVSYSDWHADINAKLDSLSSITQDPNAIVAFLTAAEAYNGNIVTANFKVKETAVAGSYEIGMDVINIQDGNNTPVVHGIDTATITVEAAEKNPITILGKDLAVESTGGQLTYAVSGNSLVITPVEAGTASARGNVTVKLDITDKEVVWDDYRWYVVNLKHNTATTRFTNIIFVDKGAFNTPPTAKELWIHAQGTNVPAATGETVSVKMSAQTNSKDPITNTDIKWTKIQVIPYNYSASNTIAATDYFEIESIVFYADDLYGEAPKYDVKFMNGEEPFGTTQQLEEGAAVVFPTTAPEKEGYEFKGWALSTAPTEVVESYTVGTAALTFVAVFEEAAGSIEAKILSASDIVAKTTAGSNMQIALNGDWARATLKTVDITGYASDNIVVDLTSLEATVDEYPYIGIFAKRNFAGQEQVNVRITGTAPLNASDKNYWPGNCAMPSDESEYYYVAKTNNIPDNTAGLEAVRICPYPNSAMTATLDDYMDIKFIALFKSEEDAQNFDYAAWLAEQNATTQGASAVFTGADLFAAYETAANSGTANNVRADMSLEIGEDGKNYLRWTTDQTLGGGACLTLPTAVPAASANYLVINYKTNAKATSVSNDILRIRHYADGSHFNSPYLANYNLTLGEADSNGVRTGSLVFDFSASTDDVQYMRWLYFGGQTHEVLNADAKYFDIEAAAFFANEADALAFSYDTYIEKNGEEVVFETEEGKTTLVVLPGDKVVLPEAPTAPEGEEFVGWVPADDTGATPIAAGETVPVTGGIKYIPKFQVIRNDDLLDQPSYFDTFIAILKMITSKKASGDSSADDGSVTIKAQNTEEAIVYDAADIIANNRSVTDVADGSGKLTAGKINLGVLTEEGMVRFTSASAGVAAGTGDRLVIKVDNIVLKDYPFVAIAYKTNIAAEKVNFNMTTANGTYPAKEHKIFFPQERKTDALAVATAKYAGTFDGDANAEATSVYIPIYSTTGAVMTDADYFDVAGIGFFKSEKDAQKFAK